MCNWLILNYQFLVYISFVNSVTSDRIWSICDREPCRCGINTSSILCSEDTLQFQPCYCMFYDPIQNTTVAGNCMLTCYALNRKPATYYLKIPRYSVDDAALFNQEMCNNNMTGVSTYREGRFCGKCTEGHGLAVYSYHYTSCIPCTDYGYKNWLRYFAVALLPLTLFYFLVVLLRINVTSSHLNGIVFIIQCMITPLQLRMIDGWIAALNGSGRHVHKSMYALQPFITILGVFNLDFFRNVYPYFCLHPRFNILHVASLDFVVAVYPFVLIFLTYLLVTMYDKNYRLVVLAWKPFRWCTRCYQREFNVRASLVHVFATFILLSNVKILGVCFDLLVPTRAYNASGSKLDRQFLYYDGTIEYFGSEHQPFAVLALFVGFVFVCLPFLLLVLYPCGCFQRCLNWLGLRCTALHILMDAFQGSYRTEPRDLRHFSAYYLLLRIVLLQIMSIIESVYVFPAMLLVMIFSALVFLIFQPYKSNSQNKLDMAAMLLMILLYSGFTSLIIASVLDEQWLHLSQFLMTLTIALLAVVFIASLFWTFGCNLCYLLKKLLKYYTLKKAKEESLSGWMERPDREVRDAYSPLLMKS